VVEGRQQLQHRYVVHSNLFGSYQTDSLLVVL
jgi:hypothetical protein